MHIVWVLQLIIQGGFYLTNRCYLYQVIVLKISCIIRVICRYKFSRILHLSRDGIVQKLNKSQSLVLLFEIEINAVAKRLLHDKVY